MKRLRLPAVLVCLLATGAAGAETGGTPGALQVRQAIEARKATYVLIARSFAPLTAMATGKLAFNASGALKRAQRLEFLAEMAHEAYPAGSAGTASRAAPLVWEDWADFDQRLQEFSGLTASLVAGLRRDSNADGSFLPTMAKIGSACKSCHEKFRSER